MEIQNLPVAMIGGGLFQLLIAAEVSDTSNRFTNFVLMFSGGVIGGLLYDRLYALANRANLKHFAPLNIAVLSLLLVTQSRLVAK